MCGSVSGGGVCYSGDSVGSVAVYFCDDGYTLDGDSTRECLSSGLWNGTTPQCVGRDRDGIHYFNALYTFCESMACFTVRQYLMHSHFTLVLHFFLSV